MCCTARTVNDEEGDVERAAFTTTPRTSRSTPTRTRPTGASETRHPSITTSATFWGVSRYSDVEAALRDPSRLSSAKGDIL